MQAATHSPVSWGDSAAADRVEWDFPSICCHKLAKSMCTPDVSFQGRVRVTSVTQYLVHWKRCYQLNPIYRGNEGFSQKAQ